MIIYLHGFNSSGNSGKAAILSEYFNTPVYSPSYPSNDIDKAIAIVSDVIETNRKEHEPLMVIGTSMGGFIANYIGRKYGAKIVLLNPALHITDALAKYIGKNKNFETGEVYNLSAEDIAKFEKYSTTSAFNEGGTLVLLNSGDDLINYKIAQEFFEGNADVRVFEGGDHRFSNMHDVLPLIEEYANAIWQ